MSRDDGGMACPATRLVTMAEARFMIGSQIGIDYVSDQDVTWGEAMHVLHGRQDSDCSRTNLPADGSALDCVAGALVGPRLLHAASGLT